MAEMSFAFLSISKPHLHFCFLPPTCVYFIPASFFIQQALGVGNFSVGLWDTQRAWGAQRKWKRGEK